MWGAMLTKSTVTAAKKVNNKDHIYPRLPQGSPNPPAGEYTYQFANNRAQEVLGLGTKELPYRTLEETVKDVMTDFKRRGW
jgi:hypothetical protein